jgi:hypothetical protein
MVAPMYIIRMGYRRSCHVYQIHQKRNGSAAETVEWLANDEDSDDESERGTRTLRPEAW